MENEPYILKDKHVDELLEMSNFLMPKFSGIYISDQRIASGTSEKDKFKLQYVVFQNESGIAMSMHWFEYCWLLLNKICSEHIESPREIADAAKCFGIFCFNRSSISHPVDFVYSYYKFHLNKDK